MAPANVACLEYVFLKAKLCGLAKADLTFWSKLTIFRRLEIKGNLGKYSNSRYSHSAIFLNIAFSSRDMMEKVFVLVI